MPKFDMGAAWDDATLLLRSYSALTLTIAAAFLFLPTLAVSWFGPSPIVPADSANMDQVMQAMRENFRQLMIYQLITGLIAAIGGVGILRLWLARTGTSVSEALSFALRMLPTMVAIQILSGLAFGLGFILLLLPGLYLFGRLALSSPIVADREVTNPIQAIRDSWALTEGNGWRIFLFLFLVGLVILIAALILGGLIGAAFGTESGVGLILSGLVEASFATIGGLVSLAVSAATYRQLSMGGSKDVFG